MNKYQNEFCFFILTYGRSDNIKTLDTLKKLNYKGKWYLICSDDDETLQSYKDKYAEKVIVFNKNDALKMFDIGDNFNNKKAVVFARNICWQIAEKLNIKYFMQLDDDYTVFNIKFNKFGQFKSNIQIKNFNALLDCFIDFFIQSKFHCLAFAQGGDFIGGEGSQFGKSGFSMKRKAMNTMLCATNKPFTFLGKINEDVNAYVFHGSQGKLFGTVSLVNIEQGQTQKNLGGLTDIYLESGTYVKSFYSVLYNPSCVKIIKMGSSNPRIHHKILWNNAVPKIISEKHKKVGDING